MARRATSISVVAGSAFAPPEGADMHICCIHPPGRNEMIAITPPKIFSKEVAQNRPPHFLARSPHNRKSFQTKFPGMAPG
jgi:hypothetical protein